MPDWILTLWRSVVLFLVTLLLVRLMGKRLTAPVTLFDLVVAIVIGVAVATLSLGLIAGTTGTVVLAVWVVLPTIAYLLSIKYKSIRDVVQSKETILINHGQVLEDKLMEVRLTPEDLLSHLRRKSVFNFADVEFAVMEPSGDVSVLLKKDKQPLTAKTMRVAVGMESVPQTVVLDGVIMDEALASMGLNRHWLHVELEKIGVAKENVFIGQVDSGGQLYVDLFDDAITIPAPKTKQLAYATLKKCQADTELYALGTQDSETKAMYGRSSSVLAEVANELEPWLKR